MDCRDWTGAPHLTYRHSDLLGPVRPFLQLPAGQRHPHRTREHLEQWLYVEQPEASLWGGLRASSSSYSCWRGYLIKSIKKCTSFIIFISCSKQLPLSLSIFQFCSFPYLTQLSSRAHLCTTYAKGVSPFHVFTLFHLIFPNLILLWCQRIHLGTAHVEKQKEKEKIHIHYPPVPTILPWDWSEGPVSHVREPVSR